MNSWVPPSLFGGAPCRILSRLVLAGAVAAVAVGALQAYTSSRTSGNQDDDPVRRGEGLVLGPFVFSPSVSTNWSYDDNIFTVSKGTCVVDTNRDGTCEETARPQGGSLMTARGTFALKLPFSHSYASLTWIPRYREYNQYKVPLKMSHYLSFKTLLNFGNGSTIQFADDFDHGYQEARQVDAFGNLQFSSTALVRNHPEITYDWSIAGVWGFLGKLERTDVTYEPTEVIDFSSFTGGSGDERSGLFQFFDSKSERVEAGGYWNFSRTRVYATTSVGRTVQDRTKFNASEQRECQSVPHENGACPLGTASEKISEAGVGVGITGQILPSTEADLEVGLDHWRFTERNTPDLTSLSISLRLDHTFNRRMSGYAELKRAPFQASGLVTGYYVSEDLNVGVERHLTMRVSTRASLSAHRYSYSGSDESAAFSLTDYNGQFELFYRPGQAGRQGPFQVSLLYSPLRRVSDRSDLLYRSQRVTVSLFYGWF